MTSVRLDDAERAALASDVRVKWEKDHRDIVLGLEPFAHVSPVLDRWAHDARLDPMKDVIGIDDIDLFTGKLNVKRAARRADRAASTS